MNLKTSLPVFLVFPLVMFLFLSSCDEEMVTDDVSFDRKSMLISLADGLIIPGFETLQTSVDDLQNAVTVFANAPTSENLLSARTAWELAVTDYQYTSAFGFGPGSLPLGPFSTVLGVFPVDENQVETNILNPDFNLAASFDRDVRGFFAIEYLLYGNGQTDEELIGSFSEDRLDYLELITAEVYTTITAIAGEWTNSYREVFITSEGTSAGSSVSLLYNEFVKDYENLKNFKVELPAGLTAGQNSSDPTLVEAYYSGISSQLLRAHFNSSKNIWAGRSRQGEELIGFEEYLETVIGGPELITQTQVALSDVDQALDRLQEGSLSDQVESDEVRLLRDLLQANTANFKSSMSSLLGISITFNSGDGD